MSIYFGWAKVAGLVSVCFSHYNRLEKCVQEFGFHFFPSPSYWQIGYSESWYDGPDYYFGFGPYLLICWRGC